jgi:hypothetical protein
MQFEQPKKGEAIGIVAGYVLSYTIFTTVLFGVLFFLHKLPSSWSYMHIMAITAFVAGMGFIVRRLLK